MGSLVDPMFTFALCFQRLMSDWMDIYPVGMSGVLTTPREDIPIS